MSTIALDVQDDGDIMDNDDTGAVRGILPGKTDDVREAKSDYAKLMHYPTGPRRNRT